MYDNIKIIHIISIFVFLAHMLLRLVFLLSSSHERLLMYRSKSGWLNFILLTIILLTGIYLGFNYDYSTGMWLVVKLGLVIFISFTNYFSFRYSSKLLGLLTLLIYIYIIYISYGKHIPA